MAHREILQLLVKCPHAKAGCTTLMHLGDVQSHVQICSHHHGQAQATAAAASANPEAIPPALKETLTCEACGELLENEAGDDLNNRHKAMICPNVKIACPFTTVGCADKIPRKDLNAHVATQTQKHMSLLAEKCNKLQQTQSLSQPVATETAAYDSGLGMTRTYSGSAIQVGLLVLTLHMLICTSKKASSFCKNIY